MPLLPPFLLGHVVYLAPPPPLSCCVPGAACRRGCRLQDRKPRVGDAEEGGRAFPVGLACGKPVTRAPPHPPLWCSTASGRRSTEGRCSFTSTSSATATASSRRPATPTAACWVLQAHSFCSLARFASRGNIHIELESLVAGIAWPPTGTLLKTRRRPQGVPGCLRVVQVGLVCHPADHLTWRDLRMGVAKSWG